jgi:beta-glucosidase
MKFLLGLFDNRYSDPEHAARISNAEEHQKLALEVAREGIVLLKNEDGILPLDKSIGRIAVIGPNADHDRNQLGDYITRIISQDVVTVLDGIEAKVSPKTKVTYVQGCDVVKEDLNQIEQAKAAASAADIAVVVVGESRRTNGEGSDVATLELTGLQQELVKAVVETETPTVVVLINGRPLATRWVAKHASAILEAWMCGEQGGTAVADVLFGDYNPSGRLPITIPRHVGQLPVYYNHKPSKPHWIKEGWGKAYRDLSAEPLYPFGFGLSYTNFEYSGLQIDPAKSGPAGTFSVSLNVRNTGNRSGHEVVQLYVNDVLSSVTTPVKELKGFQKVALDPGEIRKVEFTISPAQLSLLDRDLNRVVEPGTFQVMVGSSSEDILLEGTFEVSN